MITFLGVMLQWALKNQMVAGFFAFAGSKVYLLIEDYIKKKYFPIVKEVVIEQLPRKQPIKKPIARRRSVRFGHYLLLLIALLLCFYTFITYQQFPYLKESQIVEELEKIKLFIILFAIFLSAKLLSFSTTLKEVIETLPLIKNFFKR